MFQIFYGGNHSIINNINITSFQSLVQSTIKEGFLVGISVGSIPLMKALADELLYLAKKPFDLV